MRGERPVAVSKISFRKVEPYCIGSRYRFSASPNLLWGKAVSLLRYHLSPPHPGCGKHLMADERGETASHFDFYGSAGRRGQDDDGGDQLAQRPDRLAIVAQAFG